ncbi:hypothetical protein ACQ4PT_067924 [Festuca glaucescens]
MEAPGGNRVAFVSVVAGRSPAVVDAERDLLRHAVVATTVGSWPGMHLASAAWAFANRFSIAEGALQVSWISKGELLVRFADPQVRAVALAIEGPLVLGQVPFIIAPWTRFRKATAEVLQYRARVCIEGVPKSAWNLPAVAPFFGSDVILDEVDEVCYSEEETGRFKIWIWLDNVNKIATRGVLRLEEPVEIGSLFLLSPSSTSSPTPLRAPAQSVSFAMKFSSTWTASTTTQKARKSQSGTTGGTSPMKMACFRRRLPRARFTPACASLMLEMEKMAVQVAVPRPAMALVGLAAAGKELRDGTRVDPVVKDLLLHTNLAADHMSHVPALDRQKDSHSPILMEASSDGPTDSAVGSLLLADPTGPPPPASPCCHLHVLPRRRASPTASLAESRPGLFDILDVAPHPPSASLTALASFINDLTIPLQPPVLGTSPTTSTPASTPAPAQANLCAPDADAPLHAQDNPSEAQMQNSGRLVAKPSAGLSSMDKAKLVLLKKHGFEPDAADTAGDLMKYTNIYKQQLPPFYIKAVASLVEAGKTRRKGSVMAKTAVAV